MAGVTGESTAVIRNNNIDTIITILPAGKDAVPQFALKGTAKLDFGRIYSALLEVFYSYDGNITRYQRAGCTDDQACPNRRSSSSSATSTSSASTRRCRRASRVRARVLHSHDRAPSALTPELRGFGRFG